MKKFFTSNSGAMRLLRTITQGIIAVLISNADIMFSSFSWSGSQKAVIVALVIAILTPLYKALAEDEEDELDEEFEKSEIENDLGYDDILDIDEEEGEDDDEQDIPSVRL